MATPLAERDANRLPSSSTANGLKRPREDDAVIDSYDCGHDLKWNCNQVRNKINGLIRSGDYKVTHFQKELGITARSYGAFMKQKGPFDGMNNQTYEAAHDFFLYREQQGIKEPKPKKAKAEDLAEFDVSGITLDGEDDRNNVMVYDTCDDLRRKINQYLRQPKMTQAALCRELGQQFHPPKKVNASSCAAFLKKKGPTAGNDSPVFYGSYVYFEKLRIKKGGNKSKKRLDVEAHQPNGMPLESRRHGFYCRQGERPCEDEFGRISFH